VCQRRALITWVVIRVIIVRTERRTRYHVNIFLAEPLQFSASGNLTISGITRNNSQLLRVFFYAFLACYRIMIVSINGQIIDTIIILSILFLHGVPKITDFSAQKRRIVCPWRVNFDCGQPIGSSVYSVCLENYQGYATTHTLSINTQYPIWKTQWPVSESKCYSSTLSKDFTACRRALCYHVASKVPLGRWIIWCCNFEKKKHFLDVLTVKFGFVGRLVYNIHWFT
jgi:hypothetical protein